MLVDQLLSEIFTYEITIAELFFQRIFSTVLLFTVPGSVAVAQTTFNTVSQNVRRSWKEAIIYQVYPGSTMYSDGIGDLKGLLSKKDYIKYPGVGTAWLNPIYSSPNDDNEYDVSDYYDIMKDFGTMEDFDSLLKGHHQRGLKLV